MKVQENGTQNEEGNESLSISSSSLNESFRKIHEESHLHRKKQLAIDQENFRSKLVHSLQRTTLKPTEEQMPRKQKKMLKIKDLKKNILLDLSESDAAQSNLHQVSFFGFDSMWEYILQKSTKSSQMSHNSNDTSQNSLDGLYFQLEQMKDDRKNVQMAGEDVDHSKLQLFSQVVEVQKGRRLVVTTIRDMSPWLELEQQKNMSQIKTLAFAQAAHEFRNPLNAIISSLDLISGSVKKTRDKLYFNTARSCSQLMLYLIKDILDLSQIEAKSFILNQMNADLYEIMLECVQIFQTKATEKRIELIIDKQGLLNLPKEIYTDGNRLKQIIINIISNSIKYTEKGFVKLTGGCDKQSQSIVIRVEDTGVGMTEEQISNLFKAYTKFSINRHLNREGVGLGLTICLNLAKALGGEIKAQSIPQVGSQFTLRIPWIRPLGSRLSSSLKERVMRKESLDQYITEFPYPMHSDKLEIIESKRLPKLLKRDLYSGFPRIRQSKKLEEMAEQGSGLSKFTPAISTSSLQDDSTALPCDCPHILIVDDEPFNLIALEGLIASINPQLRVQKAYNGKEAVQKVEMYLNCSKGAHALGIFQLIITDKQMPVMNGLELARALADKKTFEIVLLSGDDGGDSQMFKMVLRKPVEMRELKKAINSLVSI
ncbi:hypothetical protein FGO68_gene16496 [Halteria grandinella]|uniref:Histidine kinase n=1 Tax=Halteria grandinella TaxID=5974 RepID=A0A8J8P1C1_HALGN|nr:hypothetical protein FGO68_gene16496 [Halteria grandinella]